MSEKLFHVGVKALIFNREGKALLFEVNTSKFKGDKIAHWDIPGGRIQEGQTASEALAREIEEEAGITESSEPEFYTSVISNIEIPISDTERVGLVLMVYKVQIADSIEIRLSDEHLKYEWVDLSEAAVRLGYKYPLEFTNLLRDKTV